MIKPNGTTENSNKANARVWNIGWFQTTYSKAKATEMQGTQNRQNNFQKITNLQTHSLISKLSTKLQLVWYWHKDRYLDQQNN